jgi:hypothetical protein
MPSLGFEAKQAVLRKYYNDNAQRLDQAKDKFLDLLDSIIAHAGLDVALASGRIKDREESIKKFMRKSQGELDESATRCCGGLRRDGLSSKWTMAFVSFCELSVAGPGRLGLVSRTATGPNEST